MNLQKIKTINNCELCKKKPCMHGCPLNNDIKLAINYVKKEEYEKAYKAFLKTSILMPICGRVCPHNRQCEGACIKSDVKIGNIETFLGDLALENKWIEKVPKDTKYKVAIIGGGPAGLTCAYYLRKNGIGVTIFEKHNYLGGILMHGIPEYRLSKKVVTKVTDNIINTGIEVVYNKELGKNISFNEIKKNYDAIFLGIGANVSNKMHIEGEKLKGVYTGNEILENNLFPDCQEKNVIVCGGGNVAIDVARTIIRLGAKKVTVIYRGSKEKMSADIKEIKNAEKDGVLFVFETNIVKIIGKNKVKKIQVAKTEKIQRNNGKIDYRNNLDAIREIPCDIMITAIGSHTSNVVRKLKLNINAKGRLQIDSNGKTNQKGVFAGGDVAGVKSTVSWASRSGRNAAYSIIEYLNVVNNK